jgi:hypothetical protein
MTDDECLDEVIITVFPPMPGIGIIEEEPVAEEEKACGDLTPVVTASKVQQTPTRELLQKAEERFGDSVCIRIAKYETRAQIDEAIEWLNAALRGSGDNTVLDAQGFSTFIGSSAPILAVNNRLSFVGTIPNENQFLTRIGATFRMKTQ